MMNSTISVNNTRLILICIILFTGFLFLFNLGKRDLWAPDEPRYAQVSKEMRDTGNFIVPHLNSAPYPDKPPLLFWLINLFSLPFGKITALSARLPSAFAGIGCCVAIFYLGKYLYQNTRLALLSSLLLATSSKFLWMAHRVAFDVLLTFFVTMAIVCFYKGYSKQKKYRKLIVAPINMREKILEMIEKEIENVQNGGEGKIIWKINSIVDPVTIGALYEASNAGVKIELIIRGICCLVPGVEGLSKNIIVRSIVGRFLEHSRVYYFYDNGREEMYLSSADIMQRNLDRRVEITFPVEDQNLKNEIMSTLIKVSLKDNIKSRELLPDCTYRFVVSSNGSKKVNSQEWLMKRVVKTHGEFIKP